MKNALIVTCCKKEFKGSLLEKSIQKMYSIPSINIQVKSIENNTAGISQCYNRWVNDKETFNLFDYTIFVHDDVYIDDLRVFDKLDDAFLHYDIVGVAGGNLPAIKEPALWHLMCARENHVGYAGHLTADNKQFMTSFGVTPSRATLIDGVFIAVKPTKIKNWKFNELNCGKFHHYDIASCLDANAQGLKIGVWPINIWHQSHGLTHFNEEFLQSQKKFLSKYS